MTKHFPVMLTEAIQALEIKSTGKYVDLTLGRGGHSREILKRLSTGLLVAFDKDEQAINESGPHLKEISGNFSLVHSDFSLLKSELKSRKIEQVDGILADIGVSSPQLDNPHRGFSYNKEARLDMRMNQDQVLDAHKIVNTYSKEDLTIIFKKYGDPKFASRVAFAIVDKRPIETTTELSSIIKESLPAFYVRKKNPSKVFFQALRIEVNGELISLERMIDDAISILKPGASLVIITFHSLEDRIVKHKFKELIKDDTGKMPIIVVKQWKAKSYLPSQQELAINKRSRSAKMRVLTKLGA